MPKYASSSSAVGVLDCTATPGLDWELLYDLHAPRLRRIIGRKVGPTLTEDVLQETFLRAFRNRHALDPDRPIVPWLITIALRAATDAQRRQLRTVESELVEEAPCEESGFSQVEEDLVRRAKALGIKHAFASLNARQRQALEAVVEGVSYEQLASFGDMRHDAAKMLVSRAKTNFRVSYVSFCRDSGLFGGAIGAALLRLRLKLQRYQEFVGEHATAFGAATITVVAVGVAAYPAARPLATHAHEATGVHELAAAIGSAASAAFVEYQPTAPLVGSASADDTDSNDGSPSTVGVDTEAGMGRDDNIGGAHFEIEATTPSQKQRTWSTYTVDCEVSPTGPVECVVWDVVAATVGQPPL
jgi:RNA polymerase sigma factor (sigma-70 family)